jgi:hypothetical protein
VDQVVLRELQIAVEHGEEVLAVHYGCEDFYKAKDRPAAVSCIAIAVVGKGSSRAFALSDAPPEVQGVEREVDFLDRFYEHLAGKPDARLVHWNMNTSSYGFEALTTRYRYLTDKYPEYVPSSSRMYDLDALIESQYGDEYARHPKLPNLAALNNLQKRFFLAGREEAAKFASGDIGAVRNSVSEKAHIVETLLRLLLDGSLRTQGSAGAIDFAGTRLDAVATVVAIGERFRYVERSLRARHDNRDTITIKDEYDAQDLLRALLKIFFDDVRDEVWTPEYAGGASRIDFVLREYGLAIELKNARSSMTDKQLGDQLIIDRDRYKADASVSHLVCLVFDHDGYLRNPRGLERDLNCKVSAEGLAVSVQIYDR